MEAKIIEYIYESYLEGASVMEIASALTEQHIKSPMGHNHWSPSTIRSILRNEKYCGDALMQKTYTKDFRTHKSIKNVDLNKYFKESHHDAIISKSDWNKVQEILSQPRTQNRIAKLRRLGNRLIATRLKDGLFKGYFVLDKRWNLDERKEFLNIISNIPTFKNEGKVP